ncbi:hypothetical protein G3I19_27560 [Streptomyces sp. SID10853]|uniref:hypothetical protein n=1 Tax=Streptomyces sp. SID10853 TaxID=2706028 RepID=UPI0013C126FC|nr:hypothetical protein [Streptomyces sp. SID10853]NDZ82225.1 hypothetical protein [Streptomyces sp. SID10853]
MAYEQELPERQDVPGPDVRVPDVRGDGFEAGTADGHEAVPVPDSVAEAGVEPAADVRGSGFETEEAGRHATTAHASGHDTGPSDAGPSGTGTDPGTGSAGQLISADEREKLERRLHGAVSGFVDAPRRAVEQADRVLDETVTRVTALLAEQSDSLRMSWHGKDGSPATEELRLALRTYREVTERLLKL